MERPPLYTIGYGAREMADFLALLKQYDIQYLIDVRSSPYSRYRPEFSKRELESCLTRHGIRYVFMGDAIGAIPEGEERREDGKIDYAALAASPRFIEGLARLQTCHEKQLPAAIMCGEQKPVECHRSRLIGVALSERGIELSHIDENGDLVTQREIILSIVGAQGDFLGTPPELLVSKKKHRPKEEE